MVTVQQEKVLGERSLKIQQLEQDMEVTRKTLAAREEEVRR